MTMVAEETPAAYRPDVVTAGRRAAEILASIETSPLFGRLRESTLAYPGCWATFTGYPVVSEWDLSADGPRLFVEALRTMALKAAVFELTADEAAAELEVSAPVDEMVHALVAQFTLLVRVQAELGVNFVHMTDRERFGYEVGGYTDQAYQSAGWGEPDRRYWVGRDETARRLGVLEGLYQGIGFGSGGRSHRLSFDAELTHVERGA